MAIKWIVSDMDGTLLNNSHQISKRTLEVLEIAQQKGIKVILASGRSCDNLIDFVSILHLDRYKGCIIGMNGQSYYDYSDNEFREFQTISPKEVNTLLIKAKHYALGAVCMTYGETYSYLPKWLSWITRLYCRLTNHTVFFGFEDEYENNHLIHDVHYPFKKPVNKVCYAQLGIYLKHFIPRIKRQLGNQYEVFVLKNRWVEIMPKGISKGHALKQIMDKYGIKEDEVLVFGDGENDLSMLELVEYGYSVDNALPQVKVRTKYHCESNDDDGIAKTVLSFLEKEERL